MLRVCSIIFHSSIISRSVSTGAGATAPSLVQDAARVGSATAAVGGTPAQAGEEAARMAREGGAGDEGARRAAAHAGVQSTCDGSVIDL